MPKPDLTYLAVRRQLDGMKAQRYEVGLRDRDSGKMIPRQWTAPEVLKSVAWLKRQNLNGHDIYIRPAPLQQQEDWYNQGLILVDDLTLGQLENMEQGGHSPATIIETSPFNFQAWVRVSVAPIPAAVTTQVAKILAKRYEGDPNTDWRHYGRLAGFTNQKPQYVGSLGHQPFVLAGKCNGKIAPKAEILLQEASKQLNEATLAKRSKTQSQARLGDFAGYSGGGFPPPLDPVMYYQQLWQGLVKEFGANLDESRADWMIGKRMAIRGYSAAMIEETLLTASPNLETRKKGHVEDYVERTVRNLFEDEDVKEALQARQAQPPFPALE
jgi:RepB DNA-primase from phage plasmid